MSDIPRDRPDGDDPDAGYGVSGAAPDGGAGSRPIAFPATGAGTAGPSTGDAPAAGRPSPEAPAPGRRSTTDPEAGRTSTTDPGARPTGPAAPAAGEQERRQRRRRQLVVAGVALAAALIVIALCAGGLAVLRSVSSISDDSREVRQSRQRGDASCLELEERLNRVAPPGSATTPVARAAAIRNENVALRPYLAELALRESDRGRALDGWRQLLDARTAYAEALDKQAPSRTPAFFVAPRTADGAAVTDRLARWSPGACAGPVRRLAAPDL